MADIKYNYKLNIKGVLSVEGDRIIVSVEDDVDYNLASLCRDFDGKLCKIGVAYEEEYSASDVDDEIEIDEETGEVI
jgi:hypothetical protein